MHANRHQLQVKGFSLPDVCLELLRQFIGIKQPEGEVNASVTMELVEASASTTKDLLADFVEAVLIAIETRGALPTSVDEGNTNVMVQAEEMRAWAWIGFPDSPIGYLGAISLTNLETTINEGHFDVVADVDVSWSEDS